MVVDVKVPTYEKWGDPEFELLLYEFKDGLNAYLKSAGSPHASLKALIDWNAAHAPTVMPFFGQEIFEKAEKKGPLTDAAYLKARDAARRLAGKEGLLAALEKDTLDAVIAPSTAAGLAHRPRAGRSLHRRRLRHRRRGGHPEPDRADGREPRPAAGPHVHGPGLRRG